MGKFLDSLIHVTPIRAFEMGFAAYQAGEPINSAWPKTIYRKHYERGWTTAYLLQVPRHAGRDR